jgi:hypothetical protein
MNLWKIILALPEVREAFVSLSPADIIGRLSCIAVILKQLKDSPLQSTAGQIAAGCLQSGLAKVEAMAEECTRNLPDMFVDLK